MLQSNYESMIRICRDNNLDVFLAITATDDYNLLKPENMSEQDYTEHKLDCTNIILKGLVR